jgi:predicted lipoprotein with Yx(FWY)xxD motif
VPPWVTRQKSDGGELYADAAGRTLYGHDPAGYHLGRVIEHPEWWRPVLADATARPVGAWSIVTRDDGSRQWAHKGLRLYTNVRDREPGDISGVRSGDRVWRPIMTSGQTMPGSGL